MSSESTTPTPPKGKNWILFFFIFLLLAGAGGGYWVFAQRSAAASSGPAPLIVTHLEVFVVNLADTEAKSYLRVGIDLGLEKRDPKDSRHSDGADQVPAMRDAIIGVLSTRHAAELLTFEGKKKLREDLLVALNGRLPAQNVKEIYFNEFLVQR